MPTRVRRFAPRDDAGANDMVGTMLLVSMVVLVGGVLATTVSDSLSTPPPSPSSFALRAPAEGDTELAVAFEGGAPLALAHLAATIERNGSALPVPREAWRTPHAETLRPGDALVLVLDRPVATGETLRVRLLRIDLNRMVADLEVRVASEPPRLQAPVLRASADPPEVVADGAAATSLLVHVSHPDGWLSVGAIVADTREVDAAAGRPATLVPLRDDGQGGDQVAGDGVWTARYVPPAGARPGTYNVTLLVTDADGRPAGELVTSLATRADPFAAVRCAGCARGDRMIEGFQRDVPGSREIGELLLKGWFWDARHPHRVQSDELLVYVAAQDGAFWALHVEFYATNRDDLGVKRIATWTRTNYTEYEPAGRPWVPLQGHVLDLLQPDKDGNWTRKASVSEGVASYRSAGIGSPARLMVLRLGDVTHKAAEQGVVAVDLVVA